MERKKGDFFWASFTDLMISLFFLMLILFAILNKERKVYQLDSQYLLDLKKIDHEIKALEETGHFEYESLYKRHLLTKKITFPINEYEINDPNSQKYLVEVAKDIDKLLQKEKNDSVRYMVIIEGQASLSGEEYSNYILSYQRAYEVYNLWQKESSKGELGFLRESEILIAGSGTGGIGRDTVNDKKNQRFLIQIVPKFKILTASEQNF